MKSFMTQQTATSGMFWFRQGLRLVRGIAIATAVASSSAVSFAQDGGSSNPSSDPQLAAFAALPPAIRAALIREGRDVMRDAMTPGALRNYVQTCLRFGPFQACESMEGPSVSAGLMEGMSVTASRGDQGWSVGAGPEYSTPGIVGGTVGATRYFDSGNVEACAGPTIGLAPVASGSVQGCYVVDRKRAREMRDVIAWAEKIAALRAQSTLGDGGRPLDPSRQDLSQLYEEFVNLIRNDPNVYNNPFATGGGSTSSAAAPRSQQNSMPPVPNRPANSTANGPGMTQNQFRAAVDQAMQRFRQAYARIQQDSPGAGSGAVFGAAAGTRAGRQLVFDEDAPRNSAPARRLPQYAPRNGYDPWGNRPDSPRNQYDDQGYRRGGSRSPYDSQGYRTDGSGSPYDVQGNRTDSPGEPDNPQSPTSDQQLVFDDNAQPSPAAANGQAVLPASNTDPDQPNAPASTDSPSNSGSAQSGPTYQPPFPTGSSSTGRQAPAPPRQNRYTPSQRLLNQVRSNPDVYNRFAPVFRTSSPAAPSVTYRPAPTSSGGNYAPLPQSWSSGTQLQSSTAPQAPSSTGSAAAVGTFAGAASGQQLVFNDNAPRSASATQTRSQYANSSDANRPISGGSVPQSQPVQAPTIPTVSQRTPGTQSQTAGLQFPGE